MTELALETAELAFEIPEETCELTADWALETRELAFELTTD